MIGGRLLFSFTLACSVVGCFNPETSDETQTDGSSSATGTDGTSASAGTSSTSTTSEATSSASSTADVDTGDSNGTGSTSSSPTGGSTDAGSSSTGPSTIDPDGPYGDCEPEDSCPLNGRLGCANTDAGKVCLPDCTADQRSCPDVDGPTPAFCMSLVGGQFGCLILCQQDSHCPAGLTCQAGFGNASICAW